MGNERQLYVYCVVKTATLRKKDGSFVCSIPFSNQFRVLSNLGNGRLYGEAYKQNKKGYTKYRGYVNAAGFTRHRVIDMAYLRYRNITGKRIPVAQRYKGKPFGWIDRDETVNAISFVNGWMLTGKGWTKADWLQKERNIIDFESVKTLAFAVITQTVKDYTLIVRKLQTGTRYSPEEFTDLTSEMSAIRKWFVDGNYLKIMENNMTGEQRLECLDKELGVTEEWIRTILTKRF